MISVAVIGLFLLAGCGSSDSDVDDCLEDNSCEEDSSAKITKLSASGYDPSGPYHPEYVLDDDLSEESRWSADGDGQTITFTLSQTATVNQVQIAFYQGAERTYTFSVQVSTDALSWNDVLTNQVSSGNRADLETFTFAGTSADYIRIIGHENSFNTWNSYTEIKIQDFESIVEMCPIMTCVDADPCTADSCSAGICEYTPISECSEGSCEVHSDCRDGDQYTEDWCVAGSCTFVQVKFRVPEIASRHDFSNTIHIDPSAAANGDGSLNSPLNTLDIAFQSDTAYLIKAGTVWEDRLSKVFVNTYIGSYGNGDMPVLNKGLSISAGSHDVTFDGIYITKDGSSAYDKLLAFNADTLNITFAYSKILGRVGSLGYPFYVSKDHSENMIIYRSEIGNSREDSLQVTLPGAMIVSNYIHNTAPCGDTIQMEWGGIDNLYIANNYIDRSNSYGKFNLLLKGGDPPSTGIVVEYNTFARENTSGSDDDCSGGAAVQWFVRDQNLLSRNLFVMGNGASAIQSYPSYAYHDYPYGIRDNHFVGHAGLYNFDYMLEPYLVFSTMAEYQAYLSENSLEAYGCTISPDTFWD
jgi:ribulose bisphosphate carboxylase small subunit